MLNHNAKNGPLYMLSSGNSSHLFCTTGATALSWEVRYIDD